MDIEELSRRRSVPEQRAIAIVGLMIRIYGVGAGEGLLKDVGRYEILIGRIKTVAERSRDVRSFWDLLMSKMCWSIGPMKYDAAVLTLIEASDHDHETLRILADRAPSTVMIARQIVKQERKTARAVRDYANAPLGALVPIDDDLESAT